MNRPIEFRAMLADTKEWVFGDLTHSVSAKDGIEKRHVLIGTDFNFTEVIPETVGQFTGLLDRNGKKIFEGDKLHRMMGVYWIVAFDKHQWRAISQSDSGLYFNANEFNEFEIIGTIHDKL